jgi:PTH1 family peptidyl-tRNA hydrolase
VKIIIGLGNPGKDYERTRHNIGFTVVDALTKRLDGRGLRSRFKAALAEGAIAGTKVVLAKPQMYMNLSGIPVREIVYWYKIDLSDLLVIYDDMDLPLGLLRLRADGSAGGHNGMKSIITELGTSAFPRLRVGIGRGGGASIAHVLSRFTATEQAEIDAACDNATNAAEMWVKEGLLATMNDVNRSTSVPAGVETADD